MKKFEKPAEVLKLSLTLSHDQTSVEKGFSVNKLMQVANLSSESMATQMMVYNHMKVNNLNAENIEVMQQLCCGVKGTRQKYLSDLDEKKMA